MRCARQGKRRWIPASAGMTMRCARQGKRRWIPASAGMTMRCAWQGKRRWIPASAGMTMRCAHGHLYLLSISHTDFCTSRCTIVSRPTPPCCDCDTPSAACEVAPISIFSSV